MRRVFPDRDVKRIPEPRDSDGLPPGRWVVRRGVRVRVPDQPALTFTAEPWPTVTLCDVCDTTHPHDERCPSCREWAERAEEQWQWERQRFANRHVIWDVLDACRTADFDSNHGRIGATTKAAPAVLQHRDPGPDHYRGVAS